LKENVTWTIKAFVDNGQALRQRHLLLLLVQVLLPVPWCCCFLVELLLWGGFVAHWRFVSMQRLRLADPTCPDWRRPPLIAEVRVAVAITVGTSD
jgi:hypothetical protein